MSEIATVWTRNSSCRAAITLPFTNFGCSQHPFVLSNFDLRRAAHISFEPIGHEISGPLFSRVCLAALDTAVPSNVDIIFGHNAPDTIQIMGSDGAIVFRSQTENRLFLIRVIWSSLQLHTC